MEESESSEFGAYLPERLKPRIAILAAPEASASVLFGLYDILGSVGLIWPDMTAAEPGEAALDVFVVAATGEAFRCSGGILVEPRDGIDDVTAAEVVIVSDIYTPSDLPLGARFSAEIGWLRRMHARGAVLASACTGSLLLAATGLLDGRSCAGHWSYVDRFRVDYPRVRFDPALILDLVNEDAGLITAGGGTSWHDLALHLVARYCGPLAASQTAKIHLLASHEDGQLPFSSMTRRRPTATRRSPRRRPGSPSIRHAEPRLANDPSSPGSRQRPSPGASEPPPITDPSTTCMPSASSAPGSSSSEATMRSTTSDLRSATRTRRSSGASSGERRAMTPAAYRRRYVPLVAANRPAHAGSPS